MFFFQRRLLFTKNLHGFVYLICRTMQLFFCDLNEREKFEIEFRTETKHLNGYDRTPFILSTPPIHYISLICFGKARSQSQSDWLIANFVETALSISKSIFEENAFDRTDYASFGPLRNSEAHFQFNENITPSHLELEHPTPSFSNLDFWRFH